MVFLWFSIIRSHHLPLSGIKWAPPVRRWDRNLGIPSVPWKHEGPHEMVSGIQLIANLCRCIYVQTIWYTVSFSKKKRPFIGNYTNRSIFYIDLHLPYMFPKKLMATSPSSHVAFSLAPRHRHRHRVPPWHSRGHRRRARWQNTRRSPRRAAAEAPPRGPDRRWPTFEASDATPGIHVYVYIYIYTYICVHMWM